MRRRGRNRRALLALTAACLACTFGVVAASTSAASARAMPAASIAPLHAALLSSEPAAGEELVTAPSRIRLVFSEPIEASLATITLAGERGDRVVLSANADPRDVHAVIAPVPLLQAGGYTVRWHVVSADGHRVDGSLDFTVAPGTGAEGTIAGSGTQSPSRLAPAPPAPEADSGFVAALGRRPAVPVLRSVAITALLALAGLTLLIATLPISGPRPLRLAQILAVITTVLLVAYTVAWSSNSAGDGRGVIESVSLTAATTPGALEVARIALAFLALWSLALARRPGLAALFSGAAVLITGASGHPAVTAPMITIPAKSIHLAAAAVWLGGLLWIVTAERHGARYVEGTRRISSLAFISVIVVVLTGIVQSALFLPRVSALNGSTYGQIVLFKIAGLLVLVLFGAFHRRAIPRLDTTMARRRLRGSVRFEILVMLAVGILGGLLAAIAPPR